MAKAKKSISQVSSQIYDLLEPFRSGDRLRILDGVRVLLGEAGGAGRAGAHGGGGAGAGRASAGTQSGVSEVGGSGAGGSDTDQEIADRGARAYFEHKKPKGKSEEFATAARFHELTSNASTVTKADFQRIIANEARRSFHVRNFGRDIDNARKAGFFNSGGGEVGGYTLHTVGLDYVDALPDRGAARAVKRAPKKLSTRRKKAGGKSGA